MPDDELIPDPDLLEMFIEGMDSAALHTQDLISNFRSNPLIKDLIEQPPAEVFVDQKSTPTGL